MIKKCLIVIIVLLTFYVLHINIKLKNIENMTNITIENMANQEEESMEDKIKGIVKKVYLADIQSIRNLSNISEKLQKGGLEIPGNLTVKGSFNYLPKGTIVAFTGKTAPSGGLYQLAVHYPTDLVSWPKELLINPFKIMENSEECSRYFHYSSLLSTNTPTKC